MATKFICLKTRHGEHIAGSVHEVAGEVPHGGYTDAEKQYVLKDGTHVTSDNAEEIDWDGLIDKVMAQYPKTRAYLAMAPDDEAIAAHMFDVDSKVS